MKFKGTQGEWNRVLLEETEFYNVRNEVQYGDYGECVAEFISDNYDALLISKAPEMLELLIKFTSTMDLVNNIEQAKKLIKEATEL
jgi:hypothetical protein